MNRLVRFPNKAKAMFKDLGDIMKFCSNDDVNSAIDRFFRKYADEENFLDYFNKIWIFGDKIVSVHTLVCILCFCIFYRWDIFTNLFFTYRDVGKRL